MVDFNSRSDLGRMTPAKVKAQMDAIDKVAQAAGSLAEKDTEENRVVDHDNWFKRWMKMKLIELFLVLVSIAGLVLVASRGCKLDTATDPGGATEARCKQCAETNIEERVRLAKENSDLIPGAPDSKFILPEAYSWFYVPGSVFQHPRCMIVSPGGWATDAWGDSGGGY